MIEITGVQLIAGIIGAFVLGHQIGWARMAKKWNEWEPQAEQEAHDE